MSVLRSPIFRSLSALILLVCLTSCAHPGPLDVRVPTIEVVPCPIDGDASFRGAAFGGGVLWLSGSAGTVLRSDDLGKTFVDVSPPGAAQLDLRDVESLGADTAIVLSAGSPAVIFRTEDGGRSWTESYRDERPEVFLDAMEVSRGGGRRRGGVGHGPGLVVFGDPIDGRFELVESGDGGVTWSRNVDRPAAAPGEAGFAASGSCLLVREDVIHLGTGGAPEGVTAPFSRVLVREGADAAWRSARAPIGRSASAGIFSLCELEQGRLVAVGGDYLAPEHRDRVAAYSDDGGKTWKSPRRMPHGYRSTVVPFRIGAVEWVACAGINGLDLSGDGGETWTNVFAEEINVLVPVGTSGVLIAAGRGGRVWRVTPTVAAE